MEAASVCHVLHNFAPYFSQINIKHFPKLCANHSGSVKLSRRWNIKNGLAVGCVAMGAGAGAGAGAVPVPGSGSEKQLESETNLEEEEWLKMGILTENCRERKGMVELLECLEREAIMGDDEGKEPTDYNRRAQIFNKSSRVFQALKDLPGNSSQQS